MGWIKKIFIFLLGLIAVLAISLFVFKSFRSSKAEKIKVPAESYSILKINIDNLALDLLKNSLNNYSEYYSGKGDSLESSKKTKLLNIGVNIPSSLIMFSLSDTSYTYYSVLDISDRGKVQVFLKDDLKLIQDSTFQGTSGIQQLYSKKHLEVLLGESKMVISVGPKSSPKTLFSLLESNQADWILANSIGEGVSEISKVDISYVDRKNNWAKVDFWNGKFVINGFFKSSLFKFPTNPIQLEFSSDNILSLELNTDLSLILKDKQEELAKWKLPIDSVYKYVGNYVSVQLKDDMVTESDTIVTYDYDDNFEMVEKKEVQKIEVPDLSFQIMASPHLLGYLPDKMFYKFSKLYSNGMIKLSTTADFETAEVFTPANNVLLFYYIKKPSAGKYLAWLPNYNKINSGIIKGKAISQDEISVSGEFHLENQDLNSFYQIFVK